jgi:hypothetical protein
VQIPAGNGAILAIRRQAAQARSVRPSFETRLYAPLLRMRAEFERDGLTNDLILRSPQQRS